MELNDRHSKLVKYEKDIMGHLTTEGLRYGAIQTREREQRFLLRLQEWFDSTNEVAKAKMIPTLLAWSTHAAQANLAGNKYRSKKGIGRVDSESNAKYRCLTFFEYLDFSEFPSYSTKRPNRDWNYRRRRWTRLAPLKIYMC